VLIEGTLPDRYRDIGMTSSIYRDEGVRIAAIETIAQLGARGRPALPLLHAVRPRFKNVRRAADAAIARLE
jgi:hypothetical protein